MYPPVIACRMLALNAGLNPSLVAELFDKMCNCASEASASSKCLSERIITLNQMGEWHSAHVFPSFVTQEDIVEIGIDDSNHKRFMTS